MNQLLSRKQKIGLFIIIVIFIIISNSISAKASSNKVVVRAAVAPMNTIIQKREGKHEGFLVDIWQRIAQEYNWEVVYDFPAITKFANTTGKKVVRAIDTTFAQQLYGIAFQKESSIRKKVNLMITKMQENEEYERLCKKWFGKSCII